MADLEILKGTLDMLILKALAWGPRHGFAVARWIRATSRDAITIEDRALYLALHRMEERGWIDAEWGVSDNNRRAKYYALTALGRKQLRAEAAQWDAYAAAVALVMRAPAWAAGGES